jgi:AraC-like DNA-binding protein
VYEERAARMPGAVVWRRAALPDDRTGRVLPDGCMDLLWWNDRLVVAGPDTVAKLTHLAAGESIVGLRLPPGVAPAVLGVPADELRDTRVPLTDLWSPGAVRDLEERAAGAPGRTLEEIAASRLAAGGGPDPVAARIVNRLRAGAPVAQVADDVGLSPRQLHRRSLAAFGYGPKTLARILRMARALAMARAGTPPAMVAALSGYADQPHLTRELRALTGEGLRTLAPPLR